MKTLKAEHIVTRRAVLAGALILVARPAAAVPINDRDSGVGADPLDKGRPPGVPRGQTDADRPPNADPAGKGRMGRQVTDQDPTRDPPGRGVVTWYSDKDVGVGADPAGAGRARALATAPPGTLNRLPPAADRDAGATSDATSPAWPRRRREGLVTDLDRGPGEDPAGLGRG